MSSLVYGNLLFNYNAAFQISEMAGLEGFEFFEIVIEKSCSRQRLPDKFAKMLAGHEPHKVKLREAGNGLRRLWDVLVVFDGEGHMYIGPGREQFARAHELQLGHFLVFRYDGDAMFTVKMFDNTMCRMYYQHDDDASNGSSSGDDEEQSGDDEEQPILANDDPAMRRPSPAPPRTSLLRAAPLPLPPLLRAAPPRRCAAPPRRSASPSIDGGYIDYINEDGGYIDYINDEGGYINDGAIDDDHRCIVNIISP
nr:putative B3 domain-containing protein Os03g0621600 [Aegilops tauschii subsp. strangulata]